MVASDRISTYDVVHPTPIPDKGKVLTGLSVLLVRPDAATSSPTTSSRPPTACPTRCAAARCSSSGWRCCRSSASCAATSPARAGRTTRRPARSRASSCPTGLQESEQLPGADLHAVDQGRGRATTRRSTSSARPSSSATASCSSELRDVSLARLLGARRARARARRHPRRHEVRVRPRRATATLVLGDEVLHAGLLALLAGRRLRARPRPAVASTSSTCATGRRGTGWDKTPPAPAIPDDVVARHARALRRGLRAHRRRAVRRLAGARRPREGAGPDPARRRGSSTRRARPSSARCRRSGFEGVAQRPRRPAGRARRRGPVAAAGDVRAAARQPADRGLRDRRRST